MFHLTNIVSVYGRRKCLLYVMQSLSHFSASSVKSVSSITLTYSLMFSADTLRSQMQV